MKKRLVNSIILGVLALVISTIASATVITDVQEYANNTSTEWFVENDSDKYAPNYYRGKYEDWGWAHDGISGSDFNSIELLISAFDVDYNGGTYYVGERDMIQIFDGSSWVSFGDLDGSDDVWAFTSFDLSGFEWAETQVNQGLQVRMDIDTENEGWMVALGKATLNIDGGSQVCVPAPGISCTSVEMSEPTSIAMLSIALVGFGLSRRRRAIK